MIEVEGEPQALDRFLAELTRRPPPLARIDNVRWSRRPPHGDPSFGIEPSDDDPSGCIFISPDIATCDDCLAELFDPRDRRFRYPFLNCTNCGPRLTIITGSPYDRERTTMASFVMCEACRAEYHDPANRRFHAQPTACPDCGPHLQLLNQAGQPISCDDPIAFTAHALLSGKIAAIKGSGRLSPRLLGPRRSRGRQLRTRKHRDEKPFAVMVADLAAARELAELSPHEAALLSSARARSCCSPSIHQRRRRGSRAGKPMSRRDAALHPAASPSAPRGRRHSPGDDQRQSLRRADRLSRRRRTDERWPASPTSSWPTTDRSTSVATTRSRESWPESNCRSGAHAGTHPSRFACRANAACRHSRWAAS